MVTDDLGNELARILGIVITELVRSDQRDLSARQLGVFLICYLENEVQTVRGLAAKLGIAKPAISRALDRLSELDLVRRKQDPLDRRSILVQRTATGMMLLRELRKLLREATVTAGLSLDIGATSQSANPEVVQSST
jgi:DNA-binding MarR family transcriptional regulator